MGIVYVCFMVDPDAGRTRIELAVLKVFTRSEPIPTHSIRNPFSFTAYVFFKRCTQSISKPILNNHSCTLDFDLSYFTYNTKLNQSSHKQAKVYDIHYKMFEYTRRIK